MSKLEKNEMIESKIDDVSSNCHKEAHICKYSLSLSLSLSQSMITIMNGLIYK